jgi:hypothetical protein
MSSTEQFDNIFRSKFNNRKLEVDEQNWENIRSKLEASREKKKRLKWFFIYILGLVCGAAMMLPFAMKTNHQVLSTELTERSGLVKNKKSSTPESAARENDTQSYFHLNPEKLIAANKQTETRKKHESSSLKFVSLSKKENVKQTVAYVPENAGNMELSGMKKASASEPINEIESDEQTKNRKKVATSLEVTLTNEPKHEVIKPDANLVARAKADSSIEHLKTISGDSISHALQLADSSIHVAGANIETASYTPNTRSKSNVWSIEAGTSFSLGWKYGDTVEGRGLNPFMGLGFTHVFNSKWELHTGIDASTVGHLSSSDHQIKHIYSSFGYQSSDSVISTNWLVYVTLPLRFDFRLNNKNSIGVGVSFSYLIGSSGKIASFDQSADKGITNRKVSGPLNCSNGFNLYNSSIMIVYRRKLTNRISAEVLPYFGLSDLKNNDFFSRKSFERDSGIKLLIRFDLF